MAGCLGTSPVDLVAKLRKTSPLLALGWPLTQGSSRSLAMRPGVPRVPLWCPWTDSATEMADSLDQKTTSDLEFYEWS